MSTLPASSPELWALSLRFEEDRFVVELSDGRAVAVPYAWYPRLAEATPEQRAEGRLEARGRALRWEFNRRGPLRRRPAARLNWN